jgi:hypothetical protein
MGIVEISLSISPDEFITALDPLIGASTADKALRLGLVDELNPRIEPVLLGGGTRSSADVGRDPIRLERTG